MRLISTQLVLTFAVVSIGCGNTAQAPSDGSAPRQFLIHSAAPTNPVGQASDLIPLYVHHVVIIFQENRTPDNLFHGLPNADIAESGLNSKHQTLRLQPIALNAPYDLDHSHLAFLEMYHRGKMDGADKVRCSGDCPPNPQFTYVKQSDVEPYFALAEQYVFADRMFQTNQGPSFPAHQFIIAGTSAPTADSDLFAAENVWSRHGPPHGLGFESSGCGAPPTDYVSLINPAGKENSTYPPCFEHRTVLDLLDAQKVDWKYYSTTGGWTAAYWNGPSAIHHIRFGPDWANVDPNSAQVLRDIKNGELPAVSWVIPTGQASDHAFTTDGSGPSWVAAVVNAIGNSKYWQDTVVFITWDDWGGFYDHVPPPIFNSYEYGFRVPLIVVSPYSKSGYVSHVMHDFGSILRFIEEAFGLPTLGYADARADDLLDCFDFDQMPRTFRTVAAPMDAKHFLEDTGPALDPDDD